MFDKTSWGLIVLSIIFVLATVVITYQDFQVKLGVVVGKEYIPPNFLYSGIYDANGNSQIPVPNPGTWHLKILGNRQDTEQKRIADIQVVESEYEQYQIGDEYHR